MLKTLNWLSITQLIKYNVLVYIYKIIKGLLPNYLFESLIFTKNVHDRITRQNNKNLLKLPQIKTEFARRNIFYYGIKLYNDMYT